MQTRAKVIGQCGSAGAEAAILLALVVVLAIAGVRAIGNSTLTKLNFANGQISEHCTLDSVPPDGPRPPETGGSHGTC